MASIFLVCLCPDIKLCAPLPMATDDLAPPRYGENLYWGWSSVPGWVPGGREAVASWSVVTLCPRYDTEPQVCRGSHLRLQTGASCGLSSGTLHPTGELGQQEGGHHQWHWTLQWLYQYWQYSCKGRQYLKWSCGNIRSNVSKLSRCPSYGMIHAVLTVSPIGPILTNFSIGIFHLSPPNQCYNH